MGIMPVEDTYNNHCPACFPANESPEIMKLFLGGIEKSPHFPIVPYSPPNGYCDLFQSGTACEWIGWNDKIVLAYWHQVAGKSALGVQVGGSWFAFAKSDQPACERYFENGFTDPFNFAYTGGWALVTTPMVMQTMIELATPIVGPDPRMELFPMEDGLIVVKFCNIVDGTNVKIKLDTALL